MKTQKTDILIIGAGLTGLSIAYFLRNKSLKVTILESRDRLGGRIYTEGFADAKPIEMGATWLGSQHGQLQKLMSTLGVQIYEQKIGKKAIYEPISTSPYYLATLPDNPEPSYRIVGGTYALINALYKNIGRATVQTGQQVKTIFQDAEYLEVVTNNQTIFAKKVISTLPPNTFVNTISCIPALPTQLVGIANNTHTWMGDSIKIALTYDRPFWRSTEVAGTIFSNVGPVTEMYDHSNYEDSFYALMGFMNGAYFSLDVSKRREKVIDQLKQYFGAQAEEFIEYHETVWRNEKATFFPSHSHMIPHQNNGHAVFQQQYLDGKLHFAGTEVSTSFPGYMEGAVASAKSIKEKILQEL